MRLEPQVGDEVAIDELGADESEIGVMLRSGFRRHPSPEVMARHLAELEQEAGQLRRARDDRLRARQRIFQAACLLVGFAVFGLVAAGSGSFGIDAVGEDDENGRERASTTSIVSSTTTTSTTEATSPTSPTTVAPRLTTLATFSAKLTSPSTQVEESAAPTAPSTTSGHEPDPESGSEPGPPDVSTPSSAPPATTPTSIEPPTTTWSSTTTWPSSTSAPDRGAGDPPAETSTPPAEQPNEPVCVEKGFLFKRTVCDEGPAGPVEAILDWLLF